MKIRYLVFVAVLAMVVFGFANTAKASSCLDENFSQKTYVEKIQCLTDVIAQLMVQLQSLQAQQITTPATGWCHDFNRNLGYAQSGNSEVGFLHVALDKENILYTPDTGKTYGSPTMTAVTQFQLKYGIFPATSYYAGYVEASTRAKLNLLYGCPQCQNLYWFDATANSDNCQSKKQFCGAFMYLGLQTFDNKSDCRAALNPAQPSITVTSPNGGENWKVGETHKINWDTKNMPANAVLSIGINGDGQTSTMTGGQITSNVLASTESYSWTIPAFLGEDLGGKKYSIYATCTNCGSVVSYAGEKYFTIIAPITPSITVTSPNGGETITRGTNYTIRWTKAGSVGNKVNIELWKGAVKSQDIFVLVDNDGSKTWSVPLTLTAGTDYKVKVFDTNTPAISDLSNANFSIVVPTATTCTGFDYSDWSVCSSSGTQTRTMTSSSPSGCIGGTPTLSRVCTYVAPITPSITVTSPNGGDQWAQGSKHDITWTKTSGTGGNVKIELYKAGVLSTVVKISGDNDGKFSWDIPSTFAVGNDYKIKVTGSVDSAPSDISDANFSIIASSSSAPVISSIVAGPVNGFNTIKLTGTGLFPLNLGMAKIDGLPNLSSAGSSGCGGLVSANGTQVDCPLNIDLTAGTHTFQALTIDGVGSNIVSFTINSPWIKPKITSIFPSTASVGTQITITGSGFDTASNFLQFTWWGGYGTNQIGLDSQIISSSNNGTIIVYTIPSLLSSCANLPGGTSCPYGAMQPLPPHDYSVSVVNANGYSEGSNLTINSVTTQPSITVTSPNGGEQWQTGTAHDITWTSSGVSTLTIQLLNTANNNLSTLASNVSASLGKYIWTPNVAVGSYKIVLSYYTTATSGISDSSNSEFTITAPVSGSVVMNYDYNGGSDPDCWTVGTTCANWGDGKDLSDRSVSSSQFNNCLNSAVKYATGLSDVSGLNISYNEVAVQPNGCVSDSSHKTYEVSYSQPLGSIVQQSSLASISSALQAMLQQIYQLYGR